MSAKQAKRERQAQRQRGEIPDLDRKRRDRDEKYESRIRQVEAAEKFKREHPEKYASQLRAYQRHSLRAMQRIGMTVSALGALGGLR